MQEHNRTVLYIILFTYFLNYCNAYKVLLVFPVPGKSHSILGEGYIRHLLDAGHEVTYLTAVLMKDPPPGLRQVDVSENAKFLVGDIFDIGKYMKKEMDIQDYFIVNSFMHDVIYNTFQLDVVQNFMKDPKERYDAVVVEWLYSELPSGFAAVFNCPLIWSSSMIEHTSVLSLINEHVNPAYFADNLSKSFTFTFWDRLRYLWVITKMNYYKWLDREIDNDNFKTVFGPAITKRGGQLPHFNDVRYNGSLMLGNSHPALGDSIALPQNYKHIGGYHIDANTAPLSKDLQKLMDESKHGVIYFSLGSMLKSNKIPEKTKRELLDVFGKLKQTVIWKLDTNITDIPSNVRLVTWAPQPSVLAHPNCILFVTHGGLLSLMETLNAAVPIIGMPFFGDQYMNIERAALKGFGKRVDFDENVTKNLEAAIKEMTGNPSYRQRSKEWSTIFNKNMLPPGKELSYWIEYVIETNGAPHLRSPALDTIWYKKYYLDLALVLVVALILIISSTVKLTVKSKIGVNKRYKKKLS